MSGEAAIVESKLAGASDLVVARLEAFLANPDDIETNHKLRVSIRTLRGLVSFLEPWQKRKQSSRVQRTLKKVVKKTSLLRELDVLASLAKDKAPQDGELISFLESQAAQERSSVHAQLADEAVRAKLTAVANELKSVSWKRDFDSIDARTRFDELVDGLQHDLDGIDVNDYELVHSVRKRAKQVRYVAEQFEAVLGSDVVATAKRMKAQQDHLGALCDARVNRDLVEGFLARGDLSPTLAQSLAALVQGGQRKGG